MWLSGGKIELDKWMDEMSLGKQQIKTHERERRRWKERVHTLNKNG